MRKIGLHEMVRPAVDLELVDCVPVQSAEQDCVLTLHMREEALATHGMRRRHGKTDQGGAECADPTIVRSDREPRSTPDSWLRLMDSDRADNVLRDAARRSDCNDRN